MRDKLTDHHIVSLYKKGANEQPSAVIDKQILALAQQQKGINTTDNKAVLNEVTPINKRRFYQTWYGQLSTAASFMLVTVLFVTNQQTINETSSYSPMPMPMQMQMEVESIQSDEEQSSTTLLKKAYTLSERDANSDLKQAESMSMKANIKKLEKSNSVKERQYSRLSAISADEVKIDETFIHIEKLLKEGDTQKSAVLIDELLLTYPSSKEQIKSRFKILLMKINGK